MLKKLLKYDLKYMIRSVGIFYILTIFFSISTRILFSLKQTFIIEVLGQISLGCMISMMANTLINTIMRSWVRFKESVYGDEAYLTHTLPVTKTSIYESKFILTLIYQLLGFIIIIISLFIALYTKERWSILVELINNTSGVLNVSVKYFIIGIIIVLYLEIFNMIQCGFLGIILGHKKNNNKITFSVFLGFIGYILSQIFCVLSLFFIGILNKDIMDIFINQSINVDTIKKVLILAIVIYSLINVLVNLLCVKKLKEGVNLE